MDTYIQRLQELSEARTKLLTEDEYARMRREMLNELTQRYRNLFLTHAVCALLCIGCVALILYGSFSRHYEYVPTAIVGLVCVLLMWRMAQAAAVKRSLSREDRLSAVDNLVAARLVSDDEATRLRTGIYELFQTRNPG